MNQDLENSPAEIKSIEIDSLSPYCLDSSFEEQKTLFDRQGYLVFKNILEKAVVHKIHSTISNFQEFKGRNNFEGFSSHRVYSLIKKDPELFTPLILHPLPLAFAEKELGLSCLLSAFLAINSLPGETVQPWHRDDGASRLPLPHPPIGVSAFWAIDQTTVTNGATEVIAGSHFEPDLLEPNGIDLDGKADSSETSPHENRIKEVKPIPLNGGDLMLAKGSLLHRGGANRSESGRLILTSQYCAGWVRQLENMYLSIPKEIAAQLPVRARQLLGYNIHDAFMGYVDGRHPERCLS